MKKFSLIVMTLAAATLVGCGNNSPVGLVDVQRIAANWDKFQSAQNALVGDQQRLAASKESTARKTRDAIAMQSKYGKILNGLTQEIQDAAKTVAQGRHLNLVVTREGVGYGGVDITPDVEKALNITEKVTPTP